MKLKHNPIFQLFRRGLKMANQINVTDSSNNVNFHNSNDGLNITVNGKNNTINIGECKNASKIRIVINGDNNCIHIESILLMADVAINVGNHVHANKTVLEIGENISMGSQNSFLLYNSGNICKVGNNCMFSSGITVRCGESPHLIFDKDTGAYLDQSDGVFIGNHVWVGEKVFIMKNVTIPHECVIGTGSIVTKRFSKENCVLAGNPAKVVKENIQWIKNHGHLEKDSIYYKSYYETVNKYKT
jgi:acetyltransferase-like isoleucine patch superfamily enzyme